MKYSLFYLPAFHEATHRDPRTLYQQIIEEVQLGEAIGLEKVWCAEHHFHPYGGDIPNPALLLGVLAQHTERIKLATGGVAVPLHRPVELAEQLAMVDVLSGGRLEIGFVRAFLAFEYDAYNVDMGESHARFREGVEVIRGLFAEDRYSVDGEFTKLDRVALRPRPIQRHPRVTLGAIATKESFELAGQQGMDLMVIPYPFPLEVVASNVGTYRDSLRNAGHDPDEFNVMAPYFFYSEADVGAAKETPREAMINYLGHARDAVSEDRWSADYKGYQGMVKIFESLMDYDLMYDERTLYGHPEKIHATLGEIAAAGITEVALVSNMPGIPHDKVMKSLEFFGQEILPAAT